MATKIDDVNEGGLEGPSEGVKMSGDAIRIIAELIAGKSLGLNGELRPEAKFQIAIRSSKERPELLDSILMEIVPGDVYPEPWIGWFESGNSPIPSKLKTPAPTDEKPAQTMKRTSARLKTATGKVASKKRAFEKAQRELEQAESALSDVKAAEAAVIGWYVTDHLISVMAPVFAMGPAWTIMRTVSSHVSDDEMEFQAGIFSGEEKIEVEAEVRQERMQLSEKIMASLDYFSGDYKFEIALRSAIENVVDEYEPKRVEMIAAGRRARGRKRMFETINPEASEDAEEVIAALEETRKTK